MKYGLQFTIKATKTVFVTHRCLIEEKTSKNVNDEIVAKQTAH